MKETTENCTKQQTEKVTVKNPINYFAYRGWNVVFAPYQTVDKK